MEAKFTADDLMTIVDATEKYISAIREAKVRSLSLRQDFARSVVEIPDNKERVKALIGDENIKDFIDEKDVADYIDEITMALRWALGSVKDKDERVVIHRFDSPYAKKGCVPLYGLFSPDKSSVEREGKRVILRDIAYSFAE